MATGPAILRRSLVPAVAVLTALGIACAAPPEGPPPLRGAVSPSGEARPIAGLTARGHATGLYPGARLRMRVRIRNPYDHAVRITSLKTRVGRGAPGCRGSWVRVRKLRREAVIPALASRRVRLRVRMRRGAPDACQGARFPLRFRMTAVRA